jgi:nitroreductase
MAETMDFFEALYIQRAIRYLKEDPVPDEMIKKIIDAGIHAPSGGNAQGWAFVVNKDAETKRKMAPLYAGVSRPSNHPEELTKSQQQNTISSGYLGDHAAEVPVWLLALTKHPGDDITHPRRIHLPRRAEHASHSACAWPW